MDNDLQLKRHSLEHVMVLAVRRVIDPEIALGVGPAIDNGFYQDFDFQLLPEHFPALEAEMRKIIEEDLPFEFSLLPIDAAAALFESRGQKYKVELLGDIKRHGTSRADRNASAEEEDVSLRRGDGMVSLYDIGGHIDLCRGPHVARSGDLKGLAFKLERTAGAYWRGSERNKMLCRVYGLAFSTQAELDQYLLNREEAKKRDHRKLGEKLDLFFFHESAPGMAYWLPKGVVLKNTLIQYWRQYHSARGYQEIQAPLLNKRELWDVSGHWQFYQDDMITCRLGKDEEWALKPMNCANAMLVWKHKPRSYRELPLRISDTDLLHRNERTGTLSGLLRARCFCQDDSHNFVSEDQIRSEINDILEIVRDFYGAFHLRENVHLYLSTRPDSFMGEIAVWDRAEKELRDVLLGSGIKFGVKEKDGAFYGPKIDIHLTDCLGREWQCGTIQLDFQLPRKFELEYVDKDGGKKTPIVIHRVIYGSLERFIGILVEHFAGRIPFWAAPVQARLIPLKGCGSDYLAEVKELLDSVDIDEPLKRNLLRYEVDEREESLSRRVRDAEVEKIPLIIVCGQRDEEARQVVIRSSKGEAGIALSELRSAIRSAAPGL